MSKWCEVQKSDNSIRLITHSGLPHCVVCGGRATIQCDGVVAQWGKTCDKWLCERHAFHPLVNGKPEWGNKDYCPEHAPQILVKQEKVKKARKDD